MIKIKICLSLVIIIAVGAIAENCRISKTGRCNDDEGSSFAEDDSGNFVTKCCKGTKLVVPQKKPKNCKATKCLPSDTRNPCSTKERPLEIMRETCNNEDDHSEGLVAICCTNNSTEGALLSQLGAEVNEFPHQVLLSVKCGGTIYNEQYILTAAHCVVEKGMKKMKPSDLSVQIGRTISDLAKNNKKNSYQVEEIIVHEDYDGDEVIYDIALIKLAKKIKFSDKAKSLQIAPSNFKPKDYADKVLIIGWGTTDTGDLSEHLQKSNYILRSDKYCFGNDGPWKNFKNYKHTGLCVGGIAEGKWSPVSGEGDSGGPAICRNKEGNAVLCGITSFGGDDKKCIEEQTEEACDPSVYAKVSYFRDWIEKHAGQQKESTFYKAKLYGEKTKEGEYPHQVHVTAKGAKDCGGTLISLNTVLTAAHCVFTDDGNERKNIRVTVGLHNLERIGGMRYEAKKVYKHKGFKRQGPAVDSVDQGNRVIMTDNFYNDDIAVIKLDQDVENVDQKDLPSLPSKTDTYNGKSTEVSYPRRNIYSMALSKRNFKLLDRSECQSRLKRMERIGLDLKLDKNILCGVEKYSGGSTCDRELGGGLICEGNVLCGIQSFRLCEMSLPNGFINVANYRDWIETKL